MTPSDLVSLFRETIDYTEEYPSNNRDGENGPEIPDVGLHRPDLVTRADGFTGAGLYRVTVEVRDAAGNTGGSGTGYFRVEQAAGLTPVYRFWSPVTTRHFYTIRAAERDKLINNYVGTWVYEGVAYYAFANADQPGVAPIYRFWSGTLGSHLFTADAAEKTRVIDNDSATWTYEGIAFYVYPLGSPPAGTSGVYRFLSPTRIGHFYTMSQAERDKLRTLYPLVWTDEQLAWYAYEA